MKQRRQSAESTDDATSLEATTHRAGSKRMTSRRTDTRRRGVRAWCHANRSDLRFLLIFGSCMAMYYLATLTPPVSRGFFPFYLRLNAEISGSMLRQIGEPVTVDGRSISSEDGPSIQVARGCDAVEPSALFVSAVLASPVPLTARLVAVALGTLMLMALNLVRVATLFLVQAYWPEAFDTIHRDVWQALFIFLAILLWGLWASRMVNKKRLRTHDVAS